MTNKEIKEKVLTKLNENEAEYSTEYIIDETIKVCKADKAEHKDCLCAKTNEAINERLTNIEEKLDKLIQAKRHTMVANKSAEEKKEQPKETGKKKTQWWERSNSTISYNGGSDTADDWLS